MLGNTVSFEVSSTARYLLQAASLLGASSGSNQAAPGVSGVAPGISPLNSANTGDAVGNILSIVSNIKRSVGAEGVSNANLATAVSAYLSHNGYTAEDAHDVLGQLMDRMMANAPKSFQSMAEAYQNGTLKMQAVADMGVETSQTVTLQFDSNGKQVGTAVDYFGGQKAADFLNGKMEKLEGSPGNWGIDKETGQNATWMAISNNYFYVTW